jgi:pectinesterase
MQQAAALIGLTLASAPALSVDAPAQAREVDDSYTIARRFEKYRGQYPGIAWAPVAPQPGQTMLFDRLYKAVGERDLHIDIFRPAPTKARDQGIVLVHGGAWRSGTKAHFYDLATRLAGRGYTVFLPEYRLSPEAPYPAGAQDVSDAIAWARAHAGEFGLSGRRIALGGASSGGQMASMIAMAQEEMLFTTPSKGGRACQCLDRHGWRAGFHHAGGAQV